MSKLTEHERVADLAQTCACLNLRRASRSISNYYDRLFLEAVGLRSTQISQLVVLYLAGPQTIQEIAGRLGLDRTTLTRNLKLLEKAGLLEIEPGADQRTRQAALTGRGTTVLLKVLPIWEEAQVEMVQGLGAKQFSTLLTQLSDLTKLTQEE